MGVHTKVHCHTVEEALIVPPPLLAPPPSSGGHHGCNGHRIGGRGSDQAFPEQLDVPDLLLQHSVEALQRLALIANGAVKNVGIGGSGYRRRSDRSSGLRRSSRPVVLPIAGGVAQLPDHWSEAVFDGGMQFPEVIGHLTFTLLEGLMGAPDQFDLSDETQQTVFLLCVFVTCRINVRTESRCVARLHSILQTLILSTEFVGHVLLVCQACL